MRVRSIEVSFGIAHSLVERFCAFVKVLYLISGELIVCANGKKHTMYPEDIIVINPGDQYSINADSKAVLFDIKFDRDVFESIGVSRVVSFDCILTVKSTDRSAKEGNDLRNHIQVLIYSYLKNGSNLNAEVMAKCYEVLNCLLSSFESTAHAEKNDDEEMLDRRIREIAGYVQENYSEKITLSNLAKKYFISDSHLSRLFRNAFGITFREYLINVRLEAAERELHKKNKSIIRVANDTGFSSLAAFNRSFKEKFGYTPSEFKDTIENDASAQSERREAQDYASEKAVHEFIKQYEAAVSMQGAVRLVEVDSENVYSYSKPWKACLNIGTALDLLNPKVQKHILKLKEIMDFDYVRIWNIFTESSASPLNAEGNYPCHRLDEAIDFLLSVNLKPFIQLGPKPKSIITSYGVTSIKRVNPCPEILKLDDKGWEDLLDDVFRHLVIKYGGQEMESWIFEMWAPCWWDVLWTTWYNEEKFAALVKTVRKYVPGALVGGCEFIEPYHRDLLPDIANIWREKGVDPDFISFSALPYEIVGMKDGKPLTSWRPEPEYIRNMVTSIRNFMDKSGLGDKKLFLTLWSITSSNRNIINDSVYKGTYIVNVAADSIDERVDLMAYWMGTDAYSDEPDTRGIMFGGVGLLTIDDIPKPSLHAFSFLKKLRSQLVAKGPGYIVTRNNFGIYSIVYYNYKSIPLSALVKKENEISYNDLIGERENNKSVQLKIVIHNVRNGVYNIRRQYVSDESGSLLDEWYRLGTYDIHVKEDIEYMSLKSIPNRIFERTNVQNNIMKIDIRARENEFGVIEIEYQPGVAVRE